MRLEAFIVLVLLGGIRNSAVVLQQCSKASALQEVAYDLDLSTKKVCLVSEVNLFASLNVSSAAWQSVGNFSAIPETAAACVYNNANIYINQTSLQGKGSITFQHSSGKAFDLVYAPAGIYVVNKTVISVAAGDPAPSDPLWMSYGTPWQICELVEGGTRLQQPDPRIINAFDDSGDCLAPSVVTPITNVRAIRLVFDSSLVPVGKHTIVLIDSRQGGCAASPLLSPLQFVVLIVTPTISNYTTTGTPPSNSTAKPVPTTISLIIVILIIVIPMIVISAVCITVVIAAVLVRKRIKPKEEKEKEIHASNMTLDLPTFDAGLTSNGTSPAELLPKEGEAEQAQKCITVVVIKKDAPWVPVLSATLQTLHGCNCNVVEFQNVVPSQLRDKSHVYAIWSTPLEQETASDSCCQVMDNFEGTLLPHLDSNKLMLAWFGTTAVDCDVDGQVQRWSSTKELDVNIAEQCATEMHKARMRHIKSSRPHPLPITALMDTISDRSQSTTPPGSATQLLEDSGVSSLTISEQNTPNFPNRRFPKDATSPLVNAFNNLKDIRQNTIYLLEEKQKKSLTEPENVPLS